MYLSIGSLWALLSICLCVWDIFKNYRHFVTLNVNGSILLRIVGIKGLLHCILSIYFHSEKHFKFIHWENFNLDQLMRSWHKPLNLRYKEIFSCVLRNSTPCFVSPLIRWSVGPSVCPLVCHTLLFFWFLRSLAHCSCSNDQVTSNMAPAHPHATGLALYPALF